MLFIGFFHTCRESARQAGMRNTQSGGFQESRQICRTRTRGMTLVEIMMGASLLAMLATTLVSLFIQNFRMSKIQAFRSQAVTTSLTILEQLRFMQYPQVETVYLAGTSGAFSVRVVDPTQTTAYVTLSLPVNVRDGVLQSATWTTVNVVVDPDSTKPRLPMKFFLTLKRNRQTSGTKVDLFEVVLLYQYLNQGCLLYTSDAADE